MVRRRHRWPAVTLRLLGIIVLAALPILSVVAYAVGLAKGQYVHVYGRNFVRETNLNYVVEQGEIRFMYSRGWSGTPPPRGGLFNAVGININRTVVTLTGDTRGDAILGIWISWWILLLASAPLLLAAFFVARPLWRRVGRTGHCPVCGYDLRATPQRCPECGANAGLRA